MPDIRVTVDPTAHKRLKALLALKGLTIKQWIIDLITTATK